jgi:hypothetical protein
MALVQFACPYCSGQFEIADPPAGQAVACPHCSAAVALPVNLPSTPLAAPQVVNPWATVEPVAQDAAPFIPLDLVSLPTTRAGRSGRRRAPNAPEPGVQRLSREKERHRRLSRRVAMMAIAVLLLVLAVAVLTRL